MESSLFVGRGDRTRTCDSLVPNQERYQLRYTSVANVIGEPSDFARAKVQSFSEPCKLLSDYFLVFSLCVLEEESLFDDALFHKDLLQLLHAALHLLFRMGSH